MMALEADASAGVGSSSMARIVEVAEFVPWPMVVVMETLTPAPVASEPMGQSTTPFK